GISCAQLDLGKRVAPRLDAFGATRFEQVPAEAPTCSPPYTIFAGEISKADVLVDARLLHGTVRLVDSAGEGLPVTCGGLPTEWDPKTGLIRRISEQDASTTEVFFFREDNLEQMVANYALTAPVAEETCSEELQHPECSDGTKNGAETDVDCGGGTAPKCPNDKRCLADTDCLGTLCSGGKCLTRPAPCADGVKQAPETDLDCGGTCGPCVQGKACLIDADCATRLCLNKVCSEPDSTCSDGAKNGSESDVDCGGSCLKCLGGKDCAAANDCASGLCTAAKCAPVQQCRDRSRGGGETDVDCGGPCPKCSNGKECSRDSDCASDLCSAGKCISCSDGLMNGTETDVDCGGACGDCPKCWGCVLDEDCVGGHCEAGKCTRLKPAPAHGKYARVRLGPSMPNQRAVREQCRAIEAKLESARTEQEKAFKASQCGPRSASAVRLGPGDRLVAFAVNHATGYAGIQAVTVPPINKIKRGPNGECQADLDAGGPLQTLESGKTVELSRCTVQELGIEANVDLYPPELALRVVRRAQDEGVKREALEHLIRTGGAATSRDDFIQLRTHWQVRRSATAARQVTATSPAPPPTTPTGLDAGVGPIRDVGDAGRLLEVYCSRLSAQALARGDPCLDEKRPEVVDVPAGVPPLAGHVVRIPETDQAMPYNKTFDVRPGSASVSVDPAQRVRTATGVVDVRNYLKRANYYVHAVGNRMYEKEHPDPKHAPPHFEGPVGGAALPGGYSDAPGGTPFPAGLPVGALSLKSVYRHREQEGAMLERFDRSREHEYRVLEVADAGFWAVGSDPSAPDDAKPRRVLEGATASAEEGDTAYEYLMSLLTPDTSGRAGTLSGEYVVRMGGDRLGVECSITIDATSKAMTGTCGAEVGAFEEILSAEDILYIELYLSGNAENVLYRFNFYGIAPRLDYLAAGSSYTAQRSSDPKSKVRPVAEPAIANFYVAPSELKGGTARLCLDKDCTRDNVIKEVKLTYVDDVTGYTVEELGGSAKELHLKQSKRGGVEGAKRFRLPLPPEVPQMPGGKVKPADVWVVLEPTSPVGAKKQTRKLGRAVGAYEGVNAAAPGQDTVAGVNLNDGHLSFAHADMAVAQNADTVSFVRTYNNQSNEPGPLGVGWRHNWEGFVVEESDHRYSVVLGGQAQPFPSCVGPDAGTPDPDGGMPDTGPGVTNCTDDGTHGSRLQITGAADKASIELMTAYGMRYRFDRVGMRNPE
ncbi:MAG: hypothetical protein HY901_33050, partial [Deltaproteobacteria bacterium]|nr:hypothetical protein [Deltaproteobacteria bacterium]